ncbi:hypothetical protein QVD17_20353 [Tagetes erecta]|uniref:UBC core domain-containing protein n=1 Tax=Tagetes erecta TaxID=13708 RepID=A0AAD8NY38_TARER|nr:hypothetical protein QVD17_20353 [Tagetes erecta]
MEKRYEELGHRVDGFDASIKELTQGMKLLLASHDQIKKNQNSYDKSSVNKFLHILSRFCNPFSCFKFTTLQPIDTRHDSVQQHITLRNTEVRLDEVQANDQIGVIDGQSTEGISVATQSINSKDKVDSINKTCNFDTSSSSESSHHDVLDTNMLKDMKNSLDYDDIKQRYDNFKEFDTVTDYSDHFYSKHTSSVKIESLPKAWHIRIKKEWKDLKRQLPEGMFVRGYEGRMDLLRAVIIGPQGTPYHDGLFFFDVCFPETYPDTPPNFEDFVVGHFDNRAVDILKAYKAYSEGVQVGCLVKGAPEEGNKGIFTNTFYEDLDYCIELVVVALNGIGVKVDEAKIPSSKLKDYMMHQLG